LKTGPGKGKPISKKQIGPLHKKERSEHKKRIHKKKEKTVKKREEERFKRRNPVTFMSFMGTGGATKEQLKKKTMAERTRSK